MDATGNDTVLDDEIAAVHRELFGPSTVLDFGPALGSEDFPSSRPRVFPTTSAT
ncbi:hypothetical protein ACH4MN_11710 [Streptomyces anulatus]